MSTRSKQRCASPKTAKHPRFAWVRSWSSRSARKRLTRRCAPHWVFSKVTAAEAGFKYNDGVRFAPLPAIMAAKKKPLDVKALAELVPGAALTTRYLKFERPAQRAAGVKVKDVSELVEKLA